MVHSTVATGNLSTGRATPAGNAPQRVKGVPESEDKRSSVQRLLRNRRDNPGSYTFFSTNPLLMSSSTPPSVPVFGPAASAGFGNHAEPFEDGSLNLHAHVVENPEATFFMRAKGDSMRDAGIFDGDLLVVDKSVKPRAGHVVVAIVNDEFYVKTLQRAGAGYRLASANPEYPDIKPGAEDSVRIWGVVRACVRQFSV